jgi:5-methylcytosine-specific restriction endonuclease McrA
VTEAAPAQLALPGARPTPLGGADVAHATCSIEGCNTRAHSRGWCNRHYLRWHSHGDPTFTKLPVERQDHAGKVCAVADCGRQRRKRDWCANHYAHWRRHGDAEASYAYKWADEKLCTVCGVTNWPDNGRRRHCSGRCQQLDSRRRGAPEPPPRKKRGQAVVKTDSIVCRGCSAVVFLGVEPGKKKKRSDTRYCTTCLRMKKLRIVGRGTITVADARSLGTTCGICMEAVDLDLMKPNPLAPSIDHVVPVAFGGTDDLANLQIAHFGCNQRKHLRATDADYGRDERQRFYHLREWRKLSAQVKAEEPDCRSCGAPAMVVDHILGIEEGGARYDRANLQPLCHRCHNRKSQAEYRRRWSA